MRTSTWPVAIGPVSAFCSPGAICCGNSVRIFPNRAIEVRVVRPCPPFLALCWLLGFCESCDTSLCFSLAQFVSFLPLLFRPFSKPRTLFGGSEAPIGTLKKLTDCQHRDRSHCGMPSPPRIRMFLV